MPQSGKLLIFCECSVPVSTLLGGVIFGGLGLYLRGVSEDCPNPQGQEPDIYECGQKLRKYFDMHFWRGRTCAPPLRFGLGSITEILFGGHGNNGFGGGPGRLTHPWGGHGGGGAQVTKLKKNNLWMGKLPVLPPEHPSLKNYPPCFSLGPFNFWGSAGGGGLQVL